MRDSQCERQLLEAARESFPSLYEGTGAERAAMDDLVLTHASLTVLLNAPRASFTPEARTMLEQTTNATEQEFAKACQLVRSCIGFQRLPATERVVIERTLFTIEAPVAGD